MRYWTEEEDQFLRDNYSKMSHRQIGESLGRTTSAVAFRMHSLGIRHREIKPWTEDEDNFIKENHFNMHNGEIGKALGRTRSAVCNRAHILGLIRPDNIRKEVQEKTLFKKGQTPYNKGMKGIHLSPDSEFKKGHKPHNTKYDGCITKRWHKREKRYSLYIRISEGEWELLNRYNWEKVNGPIPDGYIVGFKDGDTTNCNIDNLYLMSKKDNLIRNFPPGSDKRMSLYIAGKNKELRKEVEKRPELLELKRLELNLREAINAQ